MSTSAAADDLEPELRSLAVLLTPRMLGVHLIAVLAVAAAALLGLWQLDVWAGHRSDQAHDLTTAPPRPLTAVLGPDQAFPADALGRRVSFSGRWLPADTVYVAGRDQGGRTGYWAVTPVAVCGRPGACGTAPAMLVVRGWTPRPSAPRPHGRVAVVGWLQPGEDASADPDPGDDVLPALRVADLVQRVSHDLYGGYAIAQTPVRDGLAAVAPPTLPRPNAFTALRNFLYALQWWVFGGFAVYLWWRTCLDERLRPETADEDPTEEAATGAAAAPERLVGSGSVD